MKTMRQREVGKKDEWIKGKNLVLMQFFAVQEIWMFVDQLFTARTLRGRLANKLGIFTLWTMLANSESSLWDK